jgi:EAL domain-containing protein (putative c-di-GMP-specific phosphodiesterase class I)
MMTYEIDRLNALRALNLLDTSPAESFDRITRMAAQLFGLPIAAVSLTDTDRQWFKSRVGVDHWQIPRELAPCSEVSESCGSLIVQDLLADQKYKDSVLTKSGVRFYAGAPLITRDGYTLGAMCVLGTEPRDFSQQEQRALDDLAAMVMAQIELQHAFGRVDPSTGLSNRTQMADDIKDAARDNPGEERVAVLIDLLPVQQLSDALRVMGPAFVDDLGRRAVRRVRDVLPQGKLYQIDSTHFGLVLDRTEPAELHRLAQMIRLSLLASDEGTGIGMPLRPVLGMAPFVLGSMTAEDVLRIARSAAQDARDHDRPVAVYSDGEDQTHKRRFRILADIQAALLSRDQLRLVFQPRVDLQKGTCVGAEALIRWHHPELGMIGPSEFIPIIEQAGFARLLTNWVLDTALAQIAIWERRGLGLTVSVNVSAQNLDEEDFAAQVMQKIEAAGVQPAALELEVTEGTLIQNGQNAIAQLLALRNAGVRIAVDDFGTGYSSLAYLQRLPAHCVKIDRAFISSLQSAGPEYKLVASMTTMLHDLDFRVVAEGIETAATRDVLRSIGCDEAQGYFFTKPLPAEAFEDWLEKENTQRFVA